MIMFFAEQYLSVIDGFVRVEFESRVCIVYDTATSVQVQKSSPLVIFATFLKNTAERA